MAQFFLTFIIELKNIFLKGFQTFIKLLKILIPVSLSIKILTDFGMIGVLSNFFDPMVQAIGLPGIAAIVFITSALSGLYTGLLAFFAIWEPNLMNTAEVSQLGLMILITHNLPIELTVCHKAGVHFFRVLILRLFISFFAGYLIHLMCSSFNLLAEPPIIDFLVTAAVNPTWSDFFISEMVNYFWILVILILVMGLLRLVEVLKIQRLMEKYLSNLLLKIGIGKNAITLLMVGMSIGIVYGGALMIKEVEKGHLSKQDVFFSVALLSLFHAIFEDTVLVLFMGADIFIVLFFRIFFSILTLLILFKLSHQLNKSNQTKAHQFIFGY